MHSFLIHSSADGHLGCFHVLAIISSAVMNIGVHVSLSIPVSSVYMPSSGTAGRNINNLRYADDMTLIVKSEEELKHLLTKVNKESGKASLKLNIQKMKIMASGPIISWQIDGETVETVVDFFLGSKITADGDCSHEIKRHLLFGRKL